MLEKRLDELEKRISSLEESIFEPYFIKISKVSNGYCVIDNSGEKHVFEEEDVPDDGINHSALNLLYFIAGDFLSPGLGNKHSKKRVMIEIVEN